MLKKIFFSLIPMSLWEKFQPIWHQFKYPLLINVDQLADQSIQFEATTHIEEHRIRHLGQEEEFIDLMLNSIKDDEVFFDIGGCIGLVALPIALKGGQVYSFEPDPGYRKRLKRNRALNHLENSVTIIDWAVSDKDGSVTLFTDGVNGRSPSLSEVGDRGQTVVSTNSIDNAISSGELPPPNVIKLDIEGAEILALRGMRTLLNSDKKPHTILCELHPQFLTGFGSSVEECDSILNDAGYSVTYTRDRHDQIHRVYSTNRASI